MPEPSRDSHKNLIPAENWQAYPPKQEGEGWGIYPEGTGRLIDPCIAETMTDKDPEAEEADAYLLAAAPELARALERMLARFIVHTADGYHDPGGDITAARAAIKKARVIS